MTEINGASMIAIQNQMAEAELEDMVGETKDGAQKLETIKQRRSDLRDQVAKQKAEAKRLGKELEKLADRGFFSALWDDLTGTGNEDEMQAASKRLAAEIESKENEISQMQQVQKQTFEKIEQAQEDVKQMVRTLDDLIQDLGEPAHRLA